MSSMADEDSLELMQRVHSLRLAECEANPSGVDGSKAKRVRGWVSIALTDADGHHLLKQIDGAYGASCKLDIAKTPMTASSGKAMATVEKRSTLLSCHAVVEWDDWTASSLDGR